MSLSTAKIKRELGDKGLTNFQIRVLVATADIEKGKTLTYKQLAEKVGNKNAYRAVGTALKRNPFPVVIPCHRVIRSNGELGNYTAPGGKKRKRELLIGENAI